MEVMPLSTKELRIVEIISKVVNGGLTQKKASEEINMSLRQVKRLCKRFKEEGIKGLMHKSRGNPSGRKICLSRRMQVLNLIKHDYIDFGPQLIKEQLEERNGVVLSREWIRQLMIQEGLWKVKRRKERYYYQRRTRRSREGELLQVDGSPEYWFEDRGPKCCLINMVDDATSKIMECRFTEEECLDGYFKGMKYYIQKYGRPMAVYSDQHTIFKSPKSEEKPNLTQFGRAMKELGIELIHANSPQAKGRVERSHGTLQDRLIKMMRLKGISSIEEGNVYLEEFRKDYNSRFGKEAQSKEKANREIPSSMNLDDILCTKEARKVTKNLEVHYKHKVYQILPNRNCKKLIGASVLISELKKGITIEHDGKKMEYKVYGEQFYQEAVMDRKRINAFLDRKKPLTALQKRKRGNALNF
jgi:transposase